MIGLAVKNRNVPRLSVKTAPTTMAALGIGLLVALAAIARSDESTPKDQLGQSAKARENKHQKTGQVDRAKQKAARQESQAPKQSETASVTTPLPKRPLAVGHAATLTSAELDQLITQLSDKEQSQGRAGDDDDGRGVRPPDLLRHGRAAPHADAGPIVPR